MSQHENVIRYLKHRQAEHNAWRAQLREAFHPFRTLIEKHLGGGILGYSDERVTGTGLFLKLDYHYDGKSPAQLDIGVVRTGDQFVCHWGTGNPGALDTQTAERIADRLSYLAHAVIDNDYPIAYR